MPFLTLIWGSQIGRAVVSVLIGAASIAAVLLGLRLWLMHHDAAIADNARQGYVRLAEKTAAEAEIAELRRQLNAGALALDEHRKRLAAAEAYDKQQSVEREQEILAYEALLSQANRRCALNSADIEFLQHDGKAPDQRRVGSRAIPGKSKPAPPAGRLQGTGAARGPR